MRFRLFFLAATLCLSLSVSGQRNTAAISGTTADPTGAVVPGAQVTAVQTSTGTTSRTQSNENGFYQVPNLPVGTYTLRVEHAGFQAYVQEVIVLQVDQSATISVSLKVGSQGQSVTMP